MPGCGILKRTEVASLVANGERKPSILGQERVKRWCEESQKNKIGDAALLPSSKDSVVNLHGTQYLLRLAEESLPKGESQGKLWMLYTGVRCRFWLMVKQKFLVDDEPSASAIIKEEQIFSYVVNAERGSSI